jgi:hypothetical protein
LILCGQIYGPGLGRYGPTKARGGLGSDWATAFTLRASTAQPKNYLGFPSPNPFGTKHDGLGPGWPGPTQFPALLLAMAIYSSQAPCRSALTLGAVEHSPCDAASSSAEAKRTPDEPPFPGARGEFAILSLSVVNFSILDSGPQIIDTDGPTSHRQRVT